MQNLCLFHKLALTSYRTLLHIYWRHIIKCTVSAWCSIEMPAVSSIGRVPCKSIKTYVTSHKMMCQWRRTVPLASSHSLSQPLPEACIAGQQYANIIGCLSPTVCQPSYTLAPPSRESNANPARELIACWQGDNQLLPPISWSHYYHPPSTGRKAAL